MMPPYSLSKDDFESQLAANYLGHFALTGLLLPLLTNTPGSRVVSLSSLAHTWSGVHFDDMNFSSGYSKRLAYGQSKLACLMFACELQRRLHRVGYTTLSVAAHCRRCTQHWVKILTEGTTAVHASMGEMRGDLVKVGSNRRSRNMEDAACRWTVTE